MISAPATSAPSDNELLDVLLKNGVISKEQYDSLAKRGGATASSELLDILQKNGAITKEQYTKLAKPSPATPAAPVQAKAETKPPERTAAHVKLGEKGLEFESEDGNFRAKIGGRIQVDSQVSFNQPDIPPQAELSNGVGFRRLRLYTEGALWKDYEYRFEYDWARNGGGVNGITDAYLKYIHFKPFAVTIGQLNEGKSLESMLLANYLTFIERSLPNNFFIEAGPNSKYQMGLLADYFASAGEMPWTVRGGITTESVGAPAPGNSSANADFGNTNRNGLSGHTSYQLVGRATLAPIKTQDGTVVHTGAWGSWRSVDNNFNPDGSVRSGGWQFLSQPDTDIDRTNFVNTGNLTTATTIADPRRADEIAMFGAELGGAYGPFHMAAEYMRAQVSGPGYDSGNVFEGYYVQGGWFLTGETRPYDEKRGTWNRVIPFHNFAVGDSGWGPGAWEIAYRYDLIDANTRNVSGGSVNAGTLALNWYLTPRVRFMTNWVHVFSTSTAKAGTCTFPASGNANVSCFNGVTPNVWEAAVRVDF
jgi:phosphate-selective porin OprO/OprP